MKLGAPNAIATRILGKDSQPIARHSSAFDQFSGMLQTSENLSILDLSGVSQASISFITDLGHKISSEDMLATMQECFGQDFMESRQEASTAQRFLAHTLTFPDQSFDGALVWDSLQFLISPLLEQTIAELLRVMRPGALILVFFNADEKTTRVPLYNYRIKDAKTLLQVPRGSFQRTQFFNNRTLERLFQAAASMKFFLSRDQLREVIVRR